MAVDYAEMMNGSRQEETAAARATVVSFERVKPKRLTKKSKGALLKKRNAEKSTMAKKRRTAKQIAATKKLIAYNRRKARGGTKRKTIRSRGRRASAAAVVMAREPSTAIVKYEHPKKVIVTKKTKSRKKKSGKSGSASKRSSGKHRGGWTLAKRRAAGKKAAATRKRHARAGTPRRSSKRRKSSRGRRRARAVITVSASERRGRRKGRKNPRRGSRRRRGAMENPLTGVELFIGTLTGLLGFGTADVVDRLIATHKLTGVTSNNLTVYTDVPPTANPAQGTKATYGSLFNATAVCAPMNLARWAAGLGIAGVPILIAHWVSAPVGRSSLQMFGFGALMRTAGKGLIDLTATLSKKSPTGQQLYAGEQRAAAIYANDGTAAQLPAQSMTGLGRPALGAPTLQMHKAGCGCGNCKGVGYPSMPAPQMNAASVPQVPANPPAQVAPPPANTANTNDMNIAIRGLPAGFQPKPGMYDWGHKAA